MIRIFICIAFVSAMAFGQATPPRPAFDVADVHVSPRTNTPSMRGGMIRNGRFELRTATMVDLIRVAYGVEANNVVSGPAWLDTDRFDVIAQAPGGTSNETAKLMLQALLADRFRLEVHKDSKPLSGYALTLVKRSGQLKEAQGDASGKTGCRTPEGPQEKTPEGIGFVSYVCNNITMSALAESLRGMAPGYIQGNPVVDQTGLQGAWDFSARWVGRGQVAAAGGDGVSLFGAIEKLGLKLELKNIPLPVVVVDRVNQKPTDNLPGVMQKLPEIHQQFEVVEIRPSAPETTDGTLNVKSGGRLDARGITLKDLIEFAWDIDDDESLISASKFLDTNRFDIVAKASGAVSGSGQQAQLDLDSLSLMVRSMLEDRFRLKVHRDVQPVTVYALVAGKPKMKTADVGNRTSCKVTAANVANVASSVSRNYVCQNISMAQFADKLPNIAGGYVNHPVVDFSGLEGTWDFSLSFSPARAMAAGAPSGALDPNGAISLFEAVDKQLGLKLEQRKHPMPVIVIDHVEEIPTDN